MAKTIRPKSVGRTMAVKIVDMLGEEVLETLQAD